MLHALIGFMFIACSESKLSRTELSPMCHLNRNGFKDLVGGQLSRVKPKKTARSYIFHTRGNSTGFPSASHNHWPLCHIIITLHTFAGHVLDRYSSTDMHPLDITVTTSAS
jgi:hypothetical protein